jgi:hypothetical protein
MTMHTDRLAVFRVTGIDRVAAIGNSMVVMRHRERETGPYTPAIFLSRENSFAPVALHKE